MRSVLWRMVANRAEWRRKAMRRDRRVDSRNVRAVAREGRDRIRPMKHQDSDRKVLGACCA